MARVALLIGVSEYEPGLNPLPSAVKDVEAMRRVLVNPEMGGFDEAEVLKNPLRQEMEDKIYELYTLNRNQDDVLLLYFSGHGITDSGGEFYFSTRQSRKDQQGKLVPTSAVAGREVHRWMNTSKSKRLVVILDCCFSAAFAKGLTAKDSGTINLEQHLGGEGRAILTASTSTQYAFEQEGLELSIYTQYLVEGIEKGAADQDGDGFISVDELHGYASSKVREVSPTMTPEFYPVKQGYRIFLAKSPKDDPKLKYRKEVETRAKSGKGKFSTFALRMLESKRIDWGLSENEAKAIREEVLQPYREYERKLAQYQEALTLAVNEEYPFNEEELEEYQQHLGLRDEDITSIKQRVLAPKQAAYERQQELERIGQEQKRAEYEKQQAELKKQRDRELSEAVFQPPSPPGIQTQSFEFDTATINIKSGLFGLGKTCEINRSRKRAEFFAENLGNDVVLEMVAIPGGKFLMGSPENEPERSDYESPQHTVTVQPFFMGKFPVTQSQWAVVAALKKVSIDLNPEPSNFKGNNRPVEGVSWDDAIEFCARLSNKTGKTYRLPSEAEWEYACRAGTTTPFYFGETITTELANYNGNYIYGAGAKGEYREQTTDVGKFSPNPFGLFDMHGSILEWCQDAWHENYNGAPADGSVWISDNADDRLLRGGSWYYAPRYCRSAYRFRNARGGWDYDVGFRVVVAAPLRT